ncbi:MAG: FHA domain-containing protein [Treponema sp.]|jgi:predicted RNA-binding Zn-ribbon protein involved in translation (DUF1610 family)|nr:FHA domain-containing protein [Treponema sp.]
MICPSKICKQEIPDDSLYCDQCGVKISRCVKCGNPGITPRCGKCGGVMAFKGIDPPAGKPAPEPPQQQTSPAATVIAQLEPKKLFFCHGDGWNMEIADGDVLGRTNGNHTGRLGSIPVISGTHAKITFENGEWYITDQNSTNKTYVGGIIAQPGVPVKIKNNDVVQLANVKFAVREA